jgi:hypothetical protein
MLKTLSKTDPNLLAAVARLRRVQQLWGVLLIALGVLTELVSPASPSSWLASWPSGGLIPPSSPP